MFDRSDWGFVQPSEIFPGVKTEKKIFTIDGDIIEVMVAYFKQSARGLALYFVKTRDNGVQWLVATSDDDAKFAIEEKAIKHLWSDEVKVQGRKVVLSFDSPQNETKAVDLDPNLRHFRRIFTPLSWMR